MKSVWLGGEYWMESLIIVPKNPSASIATGTIRQLVRAVSWARAKYYQRAIAISEGAQLAAVQRSLDRCDVNLPVVCEKHVPVNNRRYSDFVGSLHGCEDVSVSVRSLRGAASEFCGEHFHQMKRYPIELSAASDRHNSVHEVIMVNIL